MEGDKKLVIVFLVLQIAPFLVVPNFDSKFKSPGNLWISYPHGPDESYGRVVDRTVLSDRSHGPWYLGSGWVGLILFEFSYELRMAAGIFIARFLSSYV